MASLEINIQPDEWLDITTKEELLESEVTQLREALNDRTQELELSNKKVTELEGHKSALDADLKTLQDEHELSMGELFTVEKKLEDCMAQKGSVEEEYGSYKTASMAQIKSMDEALSSSRNDVSKSRDRVNTLEAEIKDIKRQHEKETKEARAMYKEELTKRDNQARAFQKEEISKRDNELKALRANMVAKRKELASVKQDADSKTKQLEVANKQLGSVAMLAEDRKGDRVSLERSVVQKKQALTYAGKDLQQSYAQIEALRSELSDAKVASEDQIKELKDSLGAKQDELQDAIDEIMSKDLALAEKIEELKDANKQIEEAATVVKSATTQATELKEKLEESQAREKTLEDDIETQKDSYELRLDEIRDALGIKKPGSPSKPMNFPFKLPPQFKLV